MNKTKRDMKDFNDMINLIETVVEIVPSEEVFSFVPEAFKLSPDPKDIMYFALALKLKCPIWSNDKKLKENLDVTVVNIRASKKARSFKASLKNEAKAYVEKVDKHFPEAETDIQKAANELREELKDYAPFVTKAPHPADELLNLAKKFLNEKKWIIAKNACSQVIKEYHGTKYETEAKELMKQIGELEKK